MTTRQRPLMPAPLPYPLTDTHEMAPKIEPLSPADEFSDLLATPSTTRKTRAPTSRRMIKDKAGISDDTAPLRLPDLPGGGTPRLPTPSILSLTPSVPNPDKKSHARKRPANHIPRPRNAFILFRCDFVRQQTIPASVERDHRNLSRIAGMMWTSMGPDLRQPWVTMAEREKQEHEARWPGYRYKPDGLSGPKRKVKVRGVGGQADQEQSLVAGNGDEYVERLGRGRGRDRDVKRESPPATNMPELPGHSSLTYTLPNRRSSSCPPPGSQISLSSRSGLHHQPNPFSSSEIPAVFASATSGGNISFRKDSGGMARDDITTSRRPSRVLTFHSVQPVGSVFEGHSIGNPFAYNGTDTHYSFTNTTGSDNSLTFPWAPAQNAPNNNGYTLPSWASSLGFPSPVSPSVGGPSQWVPHPSPSPYDQPESGGYSLHSGNTWDAHNMTPKAMLHSPYHESWSESAQHQSQQQSHYPISPSTHYPKPFSQSHDSYPSSPSDHGYPDPQLQFNDPFSSQSNSRGPSPHLPISPLEMPPNHVFAIVGGDGAY